MNGPGRRFQERETMKAGLSSMKSRLRDAAWEFLWLPRRYERVRETGNPRKVSLFLAAVLLALLFVGLLGVLLVQDVTAGGRIFRGVTIDGKQVGGLSSAEALEVVQRSVREPLGQPLVLKHGEKEFSLDPAQIEFEVDAEKMVEKACRSGQSRFVLERMFKRLLGKPLNVNVPVYFSYDRRKLGEFVAGVAAGIDYPPADARIDISSGSPVIVLQKDGLVVKQDEAKKALLKALPTTTRLIGVPVEATHPGITEKDIGHIVIVSLSRHTLYLYNRQEPVDSYEVAVGMPEYPTPAGKFHITFKERNPSWLPTSEWAKDKQGKLIPPGPDNPLGGYWMDLGGGIGIHATPFEKTLGEDASHGCIRMAEAAAADLYSRVNVGTPVFIVP